MSEATVAAMAEQLRQYATHFEPTDWDYTRDIGDLKHIRYRRDYTAYNRLHRRLWRAFRHHFLPVSKSHWSYIFRQDETLKTRWIGFKVWLRKDSNLPDGVLDGGCIITLWEETGEYLQYVQPTVGALLADLMDARPEIPEVQAIAAEMKRINDRYGERIATNPEEPA